MVIRWLLAGGTAAALALGGNWVARLLDKHEPVVQPIAFNHSVHVKGEEMGCVDCHAGDKSARAGIADIKSCNECHKEAQGDEPNPEEEKVREYAKAKKQIPWVQVNKNAGHVYFSHRAHVTFARMKCEECHGDVGRMELPVTEPTPELHSMSACIKCHEARGATLDCLACHD